MTSATVQPKNQTPTMGNAFTSINARTDGGVFERHQRFGGAAFARQFSVCSRLFIVTGPWRAGLRSGAWFYSLLLNLLVESVPPSSDCYVSATGDGLLLITEANVRAV